MDNIKDKLIKVKSLEDLGQKLNVIVPTWDDPEDRDNHKKITKAIKDNRIYVYEKGGDFLPAIKLLVPVKLFEKDKPETDIVRFQEELSAGDLEKVINAKDSVKGNVLGNLIARKINVAYVDYGNIKAQDAGLLMAMVTLFL